LYLLVRWTGAVCLVCLFGVIYENVFIKVLRVSGLGLLRFLNRNYRSLLYESDINETKLSNLHSKLVKLAATPVNVSPSISLEKEISSVYVRMIYDRV
jgi:hypothetical protein